MECLTSKFQILILRLPVPNVKVSSTNFSSCQCWLGLCISLFLLEYIQELIEQLNTARFKKKKSKLKHMKLEPKKPPWQI